MALRPRLLPGVPFSRLASPRYAIVQTTSRRARAVAARGPRERRPGAETADPGDEVLRRALSVHGELSERHRFDPVGSFHDHSDDGHGTGLALVERGVVDTPDVWSDPRCAGLGFTFRRSLAERFGASSRFGVSSRRTTEAQRTQRNATESNQKLCCLPPSISVHSVPLW